MGPATVEAAREQMLADVALPDGFDASVIDSPLYADRYQFGVDVAQSVGCAWFDAWDDARRAGDRASVRQAVDAMGTSRRWGFLREMSKTGEYPQFIWDLADRMATPESDVPELNLTEREWAADGTGLSCDEPPQSLNTD